MHTSLSAPVFREEYLRATQVADLLGVSAKTVTRYAKEGKIPHVLTLGGHRRYPAGPVHTLAAALKSSPHNQPVDW